MLLGLTAAVVLAITVAVWLARISPSEPSVTHADASAGAPAGGTGRCVLCNAPLPRSATLEELIAEVERRIDSDVRSLPRPFSPHRSSNDASDSSRP